MSPSDVKPSFQTVLKRQWADTVRRWERLAPREQRLLTIAGAVIGAALVFMVLIEPAWTKYQRLQVQLPLLRTQAATIDGLIREAQGMQRATSGKMTAEQTRQALVDSLHAAGIEATVEADARDGDKPPPPDSLDVTVNQVSASSLMQWLASVPGQTRLTLQELALERPTDDNGRLMVGKASGVLLFVPSSPDSSR